MQREATTTAEYTLLDQQLMRKATNYFAWQARMAEQQIGRRVIEIGCGTGNFNAMNAWMAGKCRSSSVPNASVSPCCTAVTNAVSS